MTLTGIFYGRDSIAIAAGHRFPQPLIVINMTNFFKGEVLVCQGQRFNEATRTAVVEASASLEAILIMLAT